MDTIKVKVLGTEYNVFLATELLKLWEDAKCL